jgi:hypothetical protein
VDGFHRQKLEEHFKSINPLHELLMLILQGYRELKNLRLGEAEA